MERRMLIEAESVEFTGCNCIEVLAFARSPGADCDMIHTTDSPIAQTINGDVFMKRGDRLLRDRDGQLSVLYA